MNHFKFYAVIGRNGVAVMDSWAGVKSVEKYLRKITYHGFDKFCDAEDWALQMFEEWFPREGGKLLSLQLNRIVFVRKLRSEDEDW